MPRPINTDNVETLPSYQRKAMQMAFEEALDELVAQYIQIGLPLITIAHMLDVQHYAVEEAMGEPDEAF
jgi:hypothetical protein